MPYQNFVELQETISKVDINLVPLEDTIFTNCKSELKYFESSIVGTVSCMSPTYIYREIIKSGENGFLCSKGEWYEIIMKLYMKHIDETPVVKNAYTFSVENYRYSVIRKSIEDCCNKMMKES